MDEIDELKKVVENQKRTRAKIEGKIETLMEDLQEEGYETVEEAKEAMRVLNGKLKTMENTLATKTEQFKKKYAKSLAKAS